MDDDREWSRIEAELRRQPDVSPGAIANVMAEIRRPPPQRWTARAWAWLAAPRLTLSPIGALATAVVVLAAATAIARLGTAERAARDTPSPLAAGESQPGIALASATGPRQEVQFVLVADSATDVRIVGDFNNWDAKATPMRRSGSGGVWSVVVPLDPGRHVYAFVIDGKQWIADDTAPRAPENEFGTPNSIIMVGGSS